MKVQQDFKKAQEWRKKAASCLARYGLIATRFEHDSVKSGLDYLITDIHTGKKVLVIIRRLEDREVFIKENKTRTLREFYYNNHAVFLFMSENLEFYHLVEFSTFEKNRWSFGAFTNGANKNRFTLVMVNGEAVRPYKDFRPIPINGDRSVLIGAQPSLISAFGRLEGFR